MVSAQPLRNDLPATETMPATARLRAGILLASTGEDLVTLFTDALSEHGIGGHFCVRVDDGHVCPILGDAPNLIMGDADTVTVEAGGPLLQGTRVLLAKADRDLSAAEMTRVHGYAQLYAARAVALQELADDVATDCGLSLRERFVLGRRLAGLAPLDIAAESGLSVPTISAALDAAVDHLGAKDLTSAIALAARRGWLAVTNLENCTSSSENIKYKAFKNG